MGRNNSSDVHVFGERDAGKYLGGERHPVSERTLQRWRLEGAGPKFLKLGRMVRYRKSDLDSWSDAQLRASTSQNTQ